ncbi:tetratricopeptide repeat protein [Allostreptomyces psammosilenae]|uniref:Tetratricopeptide repeat protein n=1 Tax=Allostreptomyces psammosilenae TaxID=1892865 RepID=A0A853A6J2_9ACTN|nr:tetratricopeptide repeat protein [Allostreptomyces psammosilenae]NYI08464.1 hypothetical protein [Allostreptomyces psammosilenae]
MRGKGVFLVLAAVLVFYFALVGSRGVMLLRHGTPVTVLLGVAVLVMPGIGVWFLWKTYRFGQRSEALVRELAAEGGLPSDDLPRTPSGRVERAVAERIFLERKAETEAAPQDWRTWFRLAVAYRDAGDTPRARHAMQRAIRLHDAAGAAGAPAGERGGPDAAGRTRDGRAA